MRWLAGLALCLAVSAGRSAEAYAAENPIIHTGVYIEGIDVSGMTQKEAEAEVEAYVEKMQEETLTLLLGSSADAYAGRTGLKMQQYGRGAGGCRAWKNGKYYKEI